jgi:hypothetical protein
MLSMTSFISFYPFIAALSFGQFISFQKLEKHEVIYRVTFVLSILLSSHIDVPFLSSEGSETHFTLRTIELRTALGQFRINQCSSVCSWAVQKSAIVFCQRSLVLQVVVKFESALCACSFDFSIQHLLFANRSMNGNLVLVDSILYVFISSIRNGSHALS